MANFIDTLKISPEELYLHVLEDIGQDVPNLQEDQEDFVFYLGEGPNMDGYCTWVQVNKYECQARVCHLDYLERNLRQLERSGTKYKIQLRNVTKKEAYDWKARVQVELTNKFMSFRGETDRERGAMWKEIKNKRR